MLSYLEYDFFGSSYGLSSGDAPDSICPKGWRLPGYDDAQSFYHLVRVYANSQNSGSNRDTIMQIFPLSFVRSGEYDFSSNNLVLRSSDGRYWTTRSGALYLSFSKTYLYTQYPTARGSGRTLRCLVR